MDLYNLSLSEYRASADATYPADFGGCILLAGHTRPPSGSGPDATLPGFQSAVPPTNHDSVSSGYSNISESAYKMREWYVCLVL